MSACVWALVGGGFGNRFPLLCSAMRIAELCNRELRVFWGPQDEVLVKLDDLFENDLPFSVENPTTFGDHKVFPLRDENRVLTEPARVHQLPDTTNMIISGHEFVAHYDDEVTYAAEERDPFMGELGSYFARLKLQSDLAETVSELNGKIDFSRALGIHIRRATLNSIYTESSRAREWWIVDWYIQVAKSFIEKNPHINSVYLVTNNPDLHGVVASQLPIPVFFNERAGDGWSTLAFQRQALAEIVLLSRCAAILRQSGTTFSLFASVLNCAPMATIVSYDGNPVVTWSFLNGVGQGTLVT